MFGLVVFIKSLFDCNPDFMEDEVKEVIDGNICCCIGYIKIFDVI